MYSYNLTQCPSIKHKIIVKAQYSVNISVEGLIKRIQKIQ